MSKSTFDKAPVHAQSLALHLRQLAGVINSIMDGKTNNTGEVTLTENVTTTVVSNMIVSPDSSIFLTATTSNAAAETPYIVAGDEQFTITHANAATTDRTFNYMVAG